LSRLATTDAFEETPMERMQPVLPPRAIDHLLSPLRRFIAIEAASGVLLLLSAAVAIALSNSPWAGSFAAFWQVHLRIGIGSWEIDESLVHWINDGLMTIFFFVVGLEIKREIVDGELNDPRKAALPLMAALGGMIAPAVLYLTLMSGESGGRSGWGIPMATDIAFVVGFLALLGSRVPLGLKILLLALAIVDDIGAILVIAVFYSEGTSLPAPSLAVTGLGITIVCHWLGVRSFGVYAVIGVALWVAMFYSGVHPTVAGVLLGLLTPAKPFLPGVDVLNALTAAVTSAEGDDPHGDPHRRMTSVGRLKTAATETVSPLERLEVALHPWVAFVIMPLFALANAGVPLDLGAVAHPVARAVAVGLVIGKPLGIVLFSWLAVTIGLAALPKGVTWQSVVGAGCLAGIGFTMSLFIAGLALDAEELSAGKIGTITGSVVSAILGMALLIFSLPRKPSIPPASH
jgi:NhaA family Na+:H+ antiporter